MAATGIKAVLSGAGGDELFGGYPSFTRLPRAMRRKRLAGRCAGGRAAGRRLLPARLPARWRHFASSNGRLDEAYRSQRGFFLAGGSRAARRPRPARGSMGGDAVARGRSTPSRRCSTGRASTLAGRRGPARDAACISASQLLRDLDVMSMAHGLEVRVPFVDHLLLDARLAGPGAHPSLMRNKRLLHDTLTRPLPRAAVDRPKQTFTLPFGRWMRGELAAVRSLGHGSTWPAPGGLPRRRPTGTWAAWQRGDAHWSRPWGLASLANSFSDAVIRRGDFRRSNIARDYRRGDRDATAGQSAP